MIQLRPVEPNDYGYLYHLLVGSSAAETYRFRGLTPSPEAFERALWANVGAQFIIEAGRSRERAGLISIVNVLLEAQHGELNVALDPSRHSTLTLGGAAYGMLEHAFDAWPLKKIFARVPEFNADRLRGLDRFGFELEAEVADYSFAFGRFWSERWYSVTRDAWARTAQQHQELAARVVGAA